MSGVGRRLMTTFWRVVERWRGDSTKSVLVVKEVDDGAMDQFKTFLERMESQGFVEHHSKAEKPPAKKKDNKDKLSKDTGTVVAKDKTAVASDEEWKRMVVAGSLYWKF